MYIRILIKKEGIMSNLFISLLWLLPVIAIIVSVLAGIFLWLNLKVYKLKKVKAYTKEKKLKED